MHQQPPHAPRSPNNFTRSGQRAEVNGRNCNFIGPFALDAIELTPSFSKSLDEFLNDRIGDTFSLARQADSGFVIFDQAQINLLIQRWTG